MFAHCGFIPSSHPPLFNSINQENSPESIWFEHTRKEDEEEEKKSVSSIVWTVRPERRGMSGERRDLLHFWILNNL